MVVNWGLMGALVALAVYQSIAFFATLALCYKTTWFRLNNVIGSFDKEVTKNLAKYTAMALTTAATVPMSHIFIRNHLGQELGWEAAGYWEAMWRLSGAYLMLISTTLSVYYLPRLSELKSSVEIRKEIIAGYRVILPVAIVFSLLVYFLRDTIINLLYSQEFLSMAKLFFWQLIGDVLKIASWLLAFVMLSRSMMWIYIITEVVFALGFYGLTVLFVDLFGLIGVSVAHAANYILYLIVVAVVIKRALKDMDFDIGSGKGKPCINV
jgi:PST family polysaccharide transporter